MLFPKGIKCAVCSKEFFQDNRYGICTECLPEVNTRFCLRCGRNIGNMADYCNECMQKTWNFEEARSKFVYDDKAKKIVYKLKYGGGKFVARLMAEFMADCYFQNSWNVHAVTFVPMHKKREKQRGYNQSYEIAVNFAKLVDLPLIDTLKRVKFTPNLARMTRAERWEGIRNSFERTDAEIKNKRLLLIDDVFTTGATSNECARILTMNDDGAAEVYVLTFATGKNFIDLY